jgi:hypothetical protein
VPLLGVLPCLDAQAVGDGPCSGGGGRRSRTSSTAQRSGRAEEMGSGAYDYEEVRPKSKAPWRMSSSAVRCSYSSLGRRPLLVHRGSEGPGGVAPRSQMVQEAARQDGSASPSLPPKLADGGQWSRAIKNSTGHSNTWVCLPLPPESQFLPYPFLPHAEPSPSISLHRRQVPNPSPRDPSCSASRSTPTGPRIFLSIHAPLCALALTPNRWRRLGSTLKSIPSVGIP